MSHGWMAVALLVLVLILFFAGVQLIVRDYVFFGVVLIIAALVSIVLALGLIQQDVNDQHNQETVSALCDLEYCDYELVVTQGWVRFSTKDAGFLDCTIDIPLKFVNGTPRLFTSHNQLQAEEVTPARAAKMFEAACGSLS